MLRVALKEVANAFDYFDAKHSDESRVYSGNK